MPNADIDIVDHLVSDLALVAGTNVFNSPVQPPDGTDVATQAAFVFPVGGVAPEAIVGQTTALYRPDIQIMVRGPKDDPTTGLAFARSIRDSVHYAVITGYIDMRVSQSDPIYSGRDDVGNDMWSINVEPFYEA